MIRIDKPPKPPDILLNRGVNQTRRDEADYDKDPDGFISGREKLPLKNTIYGHESVKDVLLNAQHGKCCYCEEISRGEIEHYRPKGAVKQSSKSTNQYPGYYWLAYEWDNLLVSCTDCNRNKSILFPLEDEATRARNHHDNIEGEAPLLINPASVDPRDHIRFRGETPEGKTNLGRMTIEVLNLRRPDLYESRKNLLKQLKFLHKMIVNKENSDTPDMLVQEAKEELENMVSAKAEFSSMAQDFLNSIASVQRQTPNQ